MSDPWLPYGRQAIDESDVRAVSETLRSDFLTTGPMVGRFEQALAGACGAVHAVAVNSGTAALHAAYFAAGLRAGDEILTSPITFAATTNAARLLGASVRFVDVDADSGLIDPKQLEAAIGPRTRLIVPIDFTGHPADYDAINAIARRHGLTVVADAAHSLGAEYRGRKVGTLADASIFSFHPVKPITTGEGGAVLTDRADFARRAQRFRTHGVTNDASEMTHAEGPWWYEMHDLGLNYRLPDINCALGLNQLAKLDAFLARRRAIATRYQSELADVPGVRLPEVAADVLPAWHLYVVRVAAGAAARKALFERLRGRGIGVQVHYIPVYWHPYYQQLGHRRGELPCAERFYSQCVSLPIFPAMSDADVTRVIGAVRAAASELSL